MRTRFLIIATLIVTSFFSCSKKQDLNIYTVDVTKDYPGVKLKLNDIADITYIKLESGSDFLVSTRPLCISDKYIVTGGADEGEILFFTINGDTLHHFSNHGNGPHEYLYAEDIHIDEQNNEIFIHDSFLRKILVYNLYGEFVREFSAEKSYYIYPFGKEYFISYNLDNRSSVKEKPYFSLVSKVDGSESNKVTFPMGDVHDLTVQTKMDGGTFTYTAMHLPIIKSSNGYLLNELSADTVYKYSFDGGISPYILRVPSLQSMSTPVYLQIGVETSNYIFMAASQINAKSIDDMFPSTKLVYNKQKNQIYQYEVINEDYTDQEIYLDSEVIDHIDKTEYGVIRLRSENLLKALEDGKLHGKLKEIALNLNEEDNDVLMLLKFK